MVLPVLDGRDLPLGEVEHFGRDDLGLLRHSAAGNGEQQGRQQQRWATREDASVSHGDSSGSAHSGTCPACPDRQPGRSEGPPARVRMSGVARGTTARARPGRAPSPRSGAGGFEWLFWDYPARSISPDTDRDLLVRRVTAEGGWSEMSLLRSRVGDQAIRDVIERTEARGLSPQRIRFWQLILGLPARRADAWVRRGRDSAWARRARR